MKSKHMFLLCSIVILLSSCATTSFYQVYNVKPIEESILNADEFLFEDENCKISYNLWARGGDSGFEFYNKTENNIYVKLNESNFILNGFAYDYFKNRTFTTSESKSASAANTSTGSVALTGINIYNNIQTNAVKNSNSANISSSIGFATSIKEDSIICIPPKTTKIVSEYLISNTLIRNCDLFKYPKIKQIKTKSYTAENSPIVFSNRISYYINGDSKLVENEFFVSDITNYPTTKFFVYKYDEYCGQEMNYQSKYYKYYDINKFYIKYSKGTNFWKH